MANDEPEFPPEIVAEIDAFARDLTNTDDMGKVIRAHIRIERIIYAIVKQLVPFPDKLPDLNFNAIVSLALALGVVEKYGPPLRALGKLRNDFAHDLETKLTSERVNAIFGAFSESDREGLKRDYKRMQSRNPPLAGISFSALTPADKFTLLIMRLWGAARRTLTNLESDEDGPRT